ATVTGVQTCALPILGLWMVGKQPQRGCVRRTTNRATTPLGLMHLPPRFPRVARPSQPWAVGRNPFGIQRRADARLVLSPNQNSRSEERRDGKGSRGR